MGVRSTVTDVLKKAWMIETEDTDMKSLTVRPAPVEGVFHEEERDEVTLADIRNDALADMATILTEIHGPRCAVFDPACSACAAWSIYDLLTKLSVSDELHHIVVQED